MKSKIDRKFICEPLTPVARTADTAMMASGGPGLPREFRWRHGRMVIAAVIRNWRETGPCTHGSGESYARKHWFEVETGSGERASLYFERQARGGRHAGRWWLFSMEEVKG